FLYHMVRNLAGTLVEVGRGRFTPEQVKKILAARDRRGAGPTAPAEGLCLESIVFGRKHKGLLTEEERA
ncbi:MAG: tRNA pseudouridine(38-40) synthase TruA, partial [Candidatus Firestonebacteria bacterium]|nr:tRNA pseudouridine(38-40) synthase TruA [Candidatus Firestonebacteria bacterium]